MATRSDNLTGSGAIGADWTVTGTWTRTASGTQETSRIGSYRKAAYTGASMDSNDYRVEATISYNSNGNTGSGIAVRWAAGATVTGYGLIRFANEVYFVEITAGAETQVALINTPGTGSATLAMEVEGTTIRSYVNGTLRDTRTDASIASGTPGLIAYGAAGVDTPLLTTWSAVDLGGSVVTGAGSSAGVATPTAVGRSTARAAGSSAGVATATAVADDTETITGVGGSAGVATVAGGVQTSGPGNRRRSRVGSGASALRADRGGIGRAAGGAAAGRGCGDSGDAGRAQGAAAGRGL